MSKVSVEEIKRESQGLRGSIPEELASPVDHFSEESIQLLKFHGVYQQDDRDARKAARATGAGREFSCMIRTKSPGGYLPADFYLAVDKLTDLFGNGTIRVTTRGALQLHGVLKSDLHTVIHGINEHLGSTLAACGDINRNVMATPFPLRRPDYKAAQDAAFAIADALTPKTKAYFEIWQDGDLAHSSKSDRGAALGIEERSSSEPVEEPLYGKTFLPRKFKVAVTVPGDNSPDIYTNDIGVVAIVREDGTVEGYNLTAGGGLGMTHGKTATFPRLGDEFAFVPARPPDRDGPSDGHRSARPRRSYEPQTRPLEVHDRRPRHRLVPRRGRSADRLRARKLAPAAGLDRPRLSRLGRARRRQVVLRARRPQRPRRRSRQT